MEQPSAREVASGSGTGDPGPVIVAEGLSKQFGKVMAVHGLDLRIEKGEIFGLVGPDGAGKSTAIRMLATVMQPSSGRAWVAGYDVVRQAEKIKHRIGYMAQQFNLYADLSVRENMDFFADVFGVRGPERQPRIERLLRFAGLSEFEGRRAGRLSGGMKKKLALACSLVHSPEILYLDEPTTGVDPVSRREFWDIVADLHISGATILVSTPYMDEAERCSRVGLMYEGRLVICDTPARVKGLVHGQLIEVRPLPAAGNELHGLKLIRSAEAAVAQCQGVLEVQTYGDLLRVFVDDAALRLPELRQALVEHGIRPEGLRRAEPHMEEAFVSLLKQQASAVAGLEAAK